MRMAEALRLYRDELERDGTAPPLARSETGTITA